MFYFIVNMTSSSGSSNMVWDQVRAYLETKGVQYQAWMTEYEGHAGVLAKQVSELEDEEIRLVVLGGDGTINEVINGITDFERIRFGVIPTGSGNDFCRGMGIKGKPEEIMERYLQAKEGSYIDLGQVTYVTEESDTPMQRLFAISCGFGMDAIVCRDTDHSRLKKVLNKLHLGSLTYVLMTVYTLFRMKTATVEAMFGEGVSDACTFKKLIFVAAMNFRAEGGGVPMAPAADARDGLLSVCCVHGIPKWRTFFCLPLLVMAKHEWLKGFDVVNCKSAHMKISMPFTMHADGEYLGEVVEVWYNCIDSKLRMLI